MSGRWWLPEAGSKSERYVNLLGAAGSIAGTAFLVASIIWVTVDSQDGRMKTLLVWAVGVTAFGAYIVYQLNKREHLDTRFAKALAASHQAHHSLRNASYQRYIERSPRATWVGSVRDATAAFASAFSVATGASCHATVKLIRNSVSNGQADAFEQPNPNEFIVETLCRSESRGFTRREELEDDKVGDNTDFRELFSSDPNRRCFYNNDLLNTGELVYRNSHWPDRPTAQNVHYRSTMVWPIRKVVNEEADPNDLDKPLDIVVVGFLTVDSKEADIFDYSRHFDMGASFADHLLSVVWEPKLLRELYSDADALAASASADADANP